ncbi:hypothetical protein RGUI_2603 [Rhodovulum sp. P5]|uniref:hypothetical protein n=1 Tax=Rhodovulum sp. P5 TaxID=1564506 RepID=UPI0009C22328|nr:hypothetical protein [Rhodovulum sp. P5]ARE40744.1 hypothetical protein RGUI_2603 [Rhodovulum sp. P5]
MKRFALLAAAAVLTLTACNDVRDLAGAKESAAGGDLVTLADRPVTCEASKPACAQLHRIKADACLRLAQNALAVGQAREAMTGARAACALSGYDAALKGMDDGKGTVRAARMEALRVSRVTSRSTSGARGFNTRMGREAATFQSAFPDRDAGPYYRAAARYWEAAFGSSATACADLGAAKTLAAKARTGRSVPDGPAVQDALPKLEQQIAQAAASKGCS